MGMGDTDKILDGEPLGQNLGRGAFFPVFVPPIFRGGGDAHAVMTNTLCWKQEGEKNGDRR